MFQQLNKIWAPLRTARELSYIINVIDAGNENIDMGKITIKTYRIVMAVYFEDAALHLSICLPKVRATRGISSIETDLEVKFRNQEGQIATLHQKYYSAVGEHPISQQNKWYEK